MKRSTGDYEAATFIVRLWREPNVAVDPIWRGTAVHVQSGTERSIQGIESLVSFMQTWLQAGLPDAENQS